MPDIKTKKSKKGTIKTLDKAILGTQKIKDNLVSIKEKNENIDNYAEENIENIVKKTPNFAYNVNKIGINNYRKSKIKSRNIKEKAKIRKRKNHLRKAIYYNYKESKKESKSFTSKIKTKENIDLQPERYKKEKMINASKKSFQILNASVKKAKKTFKRAIKVVINTLKSIISSINTLLVFLTGGLWIAIIIIIVITLIAMMCGSIYGIFFSSEDVTSMMTINDATQYTSINQVVSELNNEFINKITKIQNDNPYNEYHITGSRAEWKEVLAVYTVKTYGENNETEVMSLDESKVQTLKEIFWEMNNIDFTKDVTTTLDVNYHWDGAEYNLVDYTKLNITITNKTANEMAEKYNFSDNQKKQLAELLQDDFSEMWSSVIYGSRVGSNNIVKVAQSQIGNTGGQPYWSWYGFDSRVEWCACFVSYCANECGYIKSGIIPKFASCQSEGVEWFKTCGLWQNGGYTPKAGNIIFFDWANSNDGQADHVGIVEKVENGRVYTIEGNSNDSCKENNYDLNSSEIMGYGTPMY